MNADRLRMDHERQLRSEHAANRWAHFANMGLASWLITQPLLINMQELPLTWSEMILGAALFVGAGSRCLGEPSGLVGSAPASAHW